MVKATKKRTDNIRSNLHTLAAFPLTPK